MDNHGIYLVEDDATAGESLRAVLHSLGHHVTLFRSAEELLEAVDETTPPSCLITDVRLSGIDGIELMQRLQERDLFFVTIVVTAFADTALTVRALQSGALTVLDKPFAPQQLARHIKQAIAIVQDQGAKHIQFQQVRQRLSRLTEGEREILQMIIEGKPNKAMASKLNLSTRTIENRRRQLYDKMRVHSVPELVKLVTELRIYDASRRAGIRAEQPNE